MIKDLKQNLSELNERLNAIPEVKEPPSTTLQIIRDEKDQLEEHWQRLLFYHLSQDEPHGLNHKLLEYILSALADRDDMSFTFSSLDLKKVKTETEVEAEDKKRPDGVMWVSGEWFICWELKIESPEGDDQTKNYVSADSFESIGLDKADVPETNHQYIYLAPKDKDPPESSEFTPISWTWIADEIRAFIDESHGIHPSRTIAQLESFTGTIHEELQMTEDEKARRRKAALFAEHQEEIAEVQQAFKNEWKKFRGEKWGGELAEALDAATRIEDPDDDDKDPSHVDDNIVLVRFDDFDGPHTEFMFWQNTKWSSIGPAAWYRNLSEGEPKYSSAGEPSARLFFAHELRDYAPSTLREVINEPAVDDLELTFYLRSTDKECNFQKNFHERFNDMDDDLLPDKSNRTGNKKNVLERTYNINLDADPFFEAYINALASAVDDHIISKPELIKEIGEVYDNTIEEDTDYSLKCEE